VLVGGVWSRQSCRNSRGGRTLRSPGVEVEAVVARRVWAGVPGSLSGAVAGFAVEVRRLGCAERSVGDRLALAGHLNAWLAESGLQVADLSEDRVERSKIAVPPGSRPSARPRR